MTCSAASQDEDASFENVQCTENKCQAIPRVMGVDESSCYLTRLGAWTNSTCSATCATGYFGQGATFTCPKTSNQNDPVMMDILCFEVTCSPYVFPTGVVSSTTSNPCSYGK